MRILKIILIPILSLVLISVGYVYYLTFQPEGRLNWGQALFLKLAGESGDQIESLKKMTVEQRSHFADAVPYNLEGLTIDTIKITADSLTVFIIKPITVIKDAPVIVYYHGGAFVLPWTNLAMAHAALLSQSFNTIVIGVNYRVAPEYPFPIPNDDCFETLLWTTQNIKKWGGDSNKIILAGESAGAALAATVAIKARNENITAIKYQVLDCPVSYMPLNTESYKIFSKGYFLEESFMTYGNESYLPDTSDYTNPLAMPFYEDSLSHIAPAVVITCKFDPLRDSGRDYAKKLKAANVPTTHLEMKGMLHNMPGPFNQGDKNKLYDKIAEKVLKSIKD